MIFSKVSNVYIYVVYIKTPQISSLFETNVILLTCLLRARSVRSRAALMSPMTLSNTLNLLCCCRVGAYVTRSVLGENVVIGENVRVEDSYIWGNVTIHEHCTILGCIIAHDVTINRQCRIGPTSFISRGLTIGPEVSLPPGARLMKRVELIGHSEEQTGDSTSDHSLSHQVISLG